MSTNRQRFQHDEVGAYYYSGDAPAHTFMNQQQHERVSLLRHPQQFGLERSSDHSVLRRSPAVSSSSLSLPGAGVYGHARSRSSPIRRRPPLVLDASSSSSTAGAAPASAPARTGQNFLRNIWKDRRPPDRRRPQLYPATGAHHAASSLSSSDSVQSHPPPPLARNSSPFALTANGVTGEETGAVAASTIARDPASAHAGYLQKLGQNVPAWKRRFFVLEKPRANLYYFLSPNDTSPRGCLDLEGAQVYVPSDDDNGDDSAEKEIDINGAGEPSGGRADNWRLELFWPDTHKCIQLEAKSQESRDAWLEALQTNQYACAEQRLTQAQHQLSACASRITELESEVKTYKLVEQELQASQAEAKSYKAKFEELDSALRKLQAHVRRTPEDRVFPETSVVGQDLPSSTSASASKEGSKENEDHEDKRKESGLPEPCLATTPLRNTSLLDASVEEDFDVWNVPGAHFAGLYNACEQLKQTVRLSQVEASQAVADCSEAQSKAEAVERRMAKAEKHLCKLWEENCGLRKVLKQRKRERQVLVREVKTLRESVEALSAERRSGEEGSSPGLNEDEERLLDELEAHVITSIRLHEQLLGGPLTAPTDGTTVAPKSMPEKNTDFRDSDGLASADSRSASVATTASATSASAVTSNVAGYRSNHVPVASLLDDQSDSDDDDLSSAPSMSSLKLEAASDRDRRGAGGNLKDGTSMASSTASSVASSPERQNPMFQLDELSVSTQGGLDSDAPRMQALGSRGEATSRLQCPFADVIESRQRDADASKLLLRSDDELQVYHLTFYSRKIGLQFQKVPPPAERRTGLLTDVIAADLRGTSNSGGNKTASELRRIAAISSQAKSDVNNRSADETCEVAKPIDAVIVCGFDGFDDSGTNVRPNLGARLVAFDGVSVEVGKWTFDSIRKSIQARSRPLTLSFRNDYLTTEQRAILTKALANVDGLAHPPPKETRMPTIQRRPSFDPSDHSGLSHESSTFVNGVVTRTPHDDEMSGVSVRSGSSSLGERQYRSPFPRSFSGARSASSSTARRDRRQNIAFRSFSDAGSSTSMMSSVAPLVSSLLYRSSKDPFTPDYLLRKPEPVENTPQHQDFQSELL